MSYIEKKTISTPRFEPYPVARDKDISSNCNHLYKVLNSNTERTYADGEPYVTDVDAVFYCEKCLDIRQVNKVIDNNA